jgi:fructokinase
MSEPEKQLEFYLKHGAGIAGIKMGEKGILISDGHKCFHMECYKVPAIDTCGAGDAFIAGFIYGRLKKWCLRKTTEFASAVAAFCVQSVGATTGIRPAEDILAFITEKKSLKFKKIHVKKLSAEK